MEPALAALLKHIVDVVSAGNISDSRLMNSFGNFLARFYYYEGNRGHSWVTTLWRSSGGKKNLKNVRIRYTYSMFNKLVASSF